MSMSNAILRTARERFTLGYVLSDVAPLALFLAVIYGITRSEGILLGLALAFLINEVVKLYRATPSTDDRWVGVGVGVFVTLGSLAWFTFEYSTATGVGVSLWFPLLTALGGVWLIFDARRDFVEGLRGNQLGDDLSASEMMLVMQHSHLVVEQLKSGPKTVPELAEGCDLTESRVREALDMTTEDETVYRVDSEATDGAERYALDESNVGSVAFVRLNAKRVARRLVQPFYR